MALAEPSSEDLSLQFQVNVLAAGKAAACGQVKLAFDLKMATMEYIAPYVDSLKLGAYGREFDRKADIAADRYGALLPKQDSDYCKTMLKGAREDLKYTNDLILKGTR